MVSRGAAIASCRVKRTRGCRKFRRHVSQQGGPLLHARIACMTRRAGDGVRPAVSRDPVRSFRHRECACSARSTSWIQNKVTDWCRHQSCGCTGVHGIARVKRRVASGALGQPNNWSFLQFNDSRVHWLRQPNTEDGVTNIPGSSVGRRYPARSPLSKF